MADLLKLINTKSLDENAVKFRQNKVEEETAKALAENASEDAQATVSKIQADQAIRKESDLANIIFAQQINKEHVVLDNEVSGTRNVIEGLGDRYEEVLADYAEVAKQTEGFSFFSHPIATIRNHVVMAQQKEQLNAMAGAISAGNAHIDDQYAKTAQRLNDYKATVMNLTQAELQAQAHEVQAGFDAAKALSDARAKEVAYVQDASRRQQFVKPDQYDRAKSDREKAITDNDTYRYMWKAYNSFRDTEPTKTDLETMAQLYEAQPEKRAMWTEAAASSKIAGTIERRDGETPEQFANRKVRTEVGKLGETRGYEVMETVSNATDTGYNPLFKLANTEIAANLQPDPDRYAAEHNIPGGGAMLNAVQYKAMLNEHNAKIAQLTVPQRADFAAQAIGRDMTQMATYNVEPPTKFAHAATLVATNGASPDVVEFFASDKARLALEASPVITGNPKMDTTLALVEAMKEFKLSNGKTLPMTSISRIVADYIRSAYEAQYAVAGQQSDAYAAFKVLRPNQQIPMEVKVTHKNASGKSHTFDLTKPVDVENLYQRQLNSVGERGRKLQLQQEVRSMSPIGNYIGNNVDSMTGAQ